MVKARQIDIRLSCIIYYEVQNVLCKLETRSLILLIKIYDTGSKVFATKFSSKNTEKRKILENK